MEAERTILFQPVQYEITKYCTIHGSAFLPHTPFTSQGTLYNLAELPSIAPLCNFHSQITFLLRTNNLRLESSIQCCHFLRLNGHVHLIQLGFQSPLRLYPMIDENHNLLSIKISQYHWTLKPPKRILHRSMIYRST